MNKVKDFMKKSFLANTLNVYIIAALLLFPLFAYSDEEEKKAKLLEYRAEMKAFTAFLKKQFFKEDKQSR